MKDKNNIVIVLVEGDILINDDVLQHVANGEISVFADGTVDTSNGELIRIDQEALAHAIAAGNTIFNLEDVL